MSRSKISIHSDGHVLCIGIDRPEKRNAFDLEMFRHLGLAYGQLASDNDLRCCLLYATGNHFTAGLDLPEWADCFSQGKLPELPDNAIDPLGLDADTRLTKPMVMAVQGTCLTIGIELLLATDIRVAASDTRFGQIEIKRGIFPVGGATIRMFQEIGWGNAMRYLLTGDDMSAEDAYRMGMVQEIVEPGDHFDRAMAIAQAIARQAPQGVQATLRSARLARLDGETAAIKQLLPDLMPLMDTSDVKEGIAAFIERREAKFTGK